MTLKNALTHFNLLVSETNKKAEIRVFEDFIQIISGLKQKDLTEAEIKSIETELDALDLNRITTNKKQYFRKALKQFKKYLKDTFSLTVKGYYANVGIALGSSFGVLFGMVFLSGIGRSLGLSLGISMGTLIGLIVGSNWDSQAKASGKMV